MLNHLDLFSGIGGFALGLSMTGGFKTTGFCEIDPFCQKVLKKHWPDVPIYEDVRNFHHDGTVDIITGGYPCQPFSVAGQRKGEKDDRHLWPEMFNCIKKYRPSWVIGENVAGHINMGLDSVLSDLESEGYGTRVFVIPACAVDAKHRRNRVWIVGHSQHNGSLTSKKTRRLLDKSEKSRGQKPERESKRASSAPDNVANNDGGRCKGACTGTKKHDATICREDVADTNNTGREEQRRAQPTQEAHKAAECGSQWSIEPDVGRVANGVPNRVDRLRALGNAVVPQIPYVLGTAILEAHHDN